MQIIDIIRIQYDYIYLYVVYKMQNR